MVVAQGSRLIAGLEWGNQGFVAYLCHPAISAVLGSDTNTDAVRDGFDVVSPNAYAGNRRWLCQSSLHVSPQGCKAVALLRAASAFLVGLRREIGLFLRRATKCPVSR